MSPARSGAVLDRSATGRAECVRQVRAPQVELRGDHARAMEGGEWEPGPILCPTCDWSAGVSGPEGVIG